MQGRISLTVMGMLFLMCGVLEDLMKCFQMGMMVRSGVGSWQKVGKKGHF